MNYYIRSSKELHDNLEMFRKFLVQNKEFLEPTAKETDEIKAELKKLSPDKRKEFLRYLKSQNSLETEI